MAGLFKFINDDAGAITTDWVALASGVLLVGIVVTFAIYNQGVFALATGINDALAEELPKADKGEGVSCETFGNC